MKPSSQRTWMAAGAFALLVVIPAALAQDQARPAERILADLSAIQAPDLPAERTQQAIQEYLTQRREAETKKAELIGELLKADPKHKALIELLPQRWQALQMSGATPEEVEREIDEAVAKIDSPELKVEAAFARLGMAVQKSRGDFAAALPQLDAFLSVSPKDDRAGQVIYAFASRLEDPAKKTELEDRLIKDFGDTTYGSMLQGERRRREQIGKPFELAFTDAINGSEVSIEGLKGKVVVIDFWATWCGPCVAELPHMKELYSQYKDKGVEFIGVSLDQPEDEGGLTALKDFVKERDIPWPQYYQGKGWASEFSGAWGINSIPAIFAVDADGNLFSVDARGKLDEMIPELIEKRDAAKAGTPASGE